MNIQEVERVNADLISFFRQCANRLTLLFVRSLRALTPLRSQEKHPHSRINNQTCGRYKFQIESDVAEVKRGLCLFRTDCSPSPPLTLSPSLPQTWRAHPSSFWEQSCTRPSDSCCLHQSKCIAAPVSIFWSAGKRKYEPQP